MPSLVVRLGATAVVAAVTLVFPLAVTPPAGAAACGSAAGVTVVVDFHQLGGGVQQVCDPAGGGNPASTLFTGNGFPLTYVQQQPGFVCRVSGKPASDPCVQTPPTTAYWGLYWSDGESGTWSYASSGAGSLTVPDGGAVAFSWQGSAKKSPPGTPAPDHGGDEPSASPSTPGGGGSGGGSGSGGGGGGQGGDGGDSAPSGSTPPTDSPGTSQAPGGSPSPSAGERQGRHEEKSDPAASETSGPSSDPPAAQAGTVTDTTEPTAAQSGTGLPGWVVPVVLVGLLGAAGATAYVRRVRGVPHP